MKTKTRKAKVQAMLKATKRRRRVERTLYDLWAESFGALERDKLGRWREQAKEDPQYREQLLDIERLVEYASRGEGSIRTLLDRWPAWLTVNWAFQDAEGKRIAEAYAQAIENLDDCLAQAVDRLADQFIQMVHRVPADRLPATVARWRSLKKNQPGRWQRWRFATWVELAQMHEDETAPAAPPADPAREAFERCRIFDGKPRSTIAPKYFRRMKQAKAKAG